jgi:hypothetical protein
MQIKYRILEAHPDEQLIVVRYYSDAVPEDSLASQVDAEGNMLRCRTDVAINLPLPTPSGADLEKLILRSCPIGLFEIKAAVADPGVDTSLSGILPMVGVEVVADTAMLTIPAKAAPPVAEFVPFVP